MLVFSISSYPTLVADFPLSPYCFIYCFKSVTILPLIFPFPIPLHLPKLYAVRHHFNFLLPYNYPSDFLFTSSLLPGHFPLYTVFQHSPVKRPPYQSHSVSQMCHANSYIKRRKTENTRISIPRPTHIMGQLCYWLPFTRVQRMHTHRHHICSEHYSEFFGASTLRPYIEGPQLFSTSLFTRAYQQI